MYQWELGRSMYTQGMLLASGLNGTALLVCYQGKRDLTLAAVASLSASVSLRSKDSTS